MSAAAREENVCRVLGEGITRSDFMEAAQQLGLVRHHVWPPSTGDDAYEEVWATIDQARAVHYVEDPISGMSYACIRGTNVTPLVADLMRMVSTYWPEELLERAYDATDHDELVNNLYRLAITFPEYDPAVLSIFGQAATEALNPLIRQAALSAIAYRAWPQSRSIVNQVARDDEDEEVKAMATGILDAWDQASDSTSR